MKDKKLKLRTKVFRVCLTVLFVTYITLYISNKYGYYEYKKHEQVTLTEEQISKFEQDIKEGKNVEIEAYLSNTNPNYQTKFSKIGLNISEYSSKLIRESVQGIFKRINDLIVE